MKINVNLANKKNSERKNVPENKIMNLNKNQLNQHSYLNSSKQDFRDYNSINSTSKKNTLNNPYKVKSLQKKKTKIFNVLKKERQNNLELCIRGIKTIKIRKKK